MHFCRCWICTCRDICMGKNCVRFSKYRRYHYFHNSGNIQYQYLNIGNETFIHLLLTIYRMTALRFATSFLSPESLSPDHSFPSTYFYLPLHDNTSHLILCLIDLLLLPILRFTHLHLLNLGRLLINNNHKISTGPGDAIASGRNWSWESKDSIYTPISPLSHSWEIEFHPGAFNSNQSYSRSIICKALCRGKCSTRPNRISKRSEIHSGGSGCTFNVRIRVTFGFPDGFRRWPAAVEIVTWWEGRYGSVEDGGVLVVGGSGAAGGIRGGGTAGGIGGRGTGVERGGDGTGEVVGGDGFGEWRHDAG